jgi:hypothetical protein
MKKKVDLFGFGKDKKLGKLKLPGLAKLLIVFSNLRGTLLLEHYGYACIIIFYGYICIFDI